MLKIDLLPKTIRQRRLVRIAIAAVVVMVAAEVGTLLFIGVSLARIPLSRILVLVWAFLIPLLLVNLLIAYVPFFTTYLPSFM